MLSPESRDVWLSTARRLREEAKRLRRHADRLSAQAADLENEAHADGKILRGRGIIEKLREHVAIDVCAHYADLYVVLAEAGYGVGGIDPLATLLTTLSRADEFELTEARSGIYRRIA